MKPETGYKTSSRRSLERSGAMPRSPDVTPNRLPPRATPIPRSWYKKNLRGETPFRRMSSQNSFSLPNTYLPSWPGRRWGQMDHDSLPNRHQSATDTFWIRHRSITHQSPIHHRSDTNPIPIHHRSITDPSPVHHRSIIDPIPIHHQSDTDPSPIHHRPIADPTPIRHRSVTDPLPIHY